MRYPFLREWRLLDAEHRITLILDGLLQQIVINRLVERQHGGTGGVMIKITWK